MKTKLEALATYLDCDLDDLKESNYDENTIECGNQEYLVLTDNEANEKCKEYILNTLWAFNAEFIAGYCDLDNAAITAIKEMQGKLCESANSIIYALIKDRLDDFIDDAIGCDGRGHFLASYDGEENESSIGDYYIYRVN